MSDLQFGGFDVPEEVLMSGEESSGWEQWIKDIKDAIKLPPY